MAKVSPGPSVHFDCNNDTQVRFHEDCVNLPRRLCESSTKIVSSGASVQFDYKKEKTGFISKIDLIKTKS